MKQISALFMTLAALCAGVAVAGAATSPTSAAQARVIAGILEHDAAVAAHIGPSIDVVRVQPVTYAPNEYVVDAASADGLRGARVLLDLQAGKVLEVRRLDPSQVLATILDVEQALAMARGLPAVRSRLGASLALYHASTSGDPSHQPYRVEALVVRSSAQHDPCAVHRCLRLLFHAPRGYVKDVSPLIDLTASRTRAQRTAPGVHFVPPMQSLTTLNPDCHVVRFFTATTSWNVCWHYVAGHGLVVGPASYHKAPGGAGFNVIADARVDEIFVPYASGSPRFFDTSFGFPLATLTQSLCVKGLLLDNGAACLEMRDRDIDWLAPLNDPPPGRRGEEAVIWSVLYAANYLYIEQWGFRDDGIFWGRVGATGQNLPGIELESHAHDYFWRIVPRLAGKGNSVNYVGVNESVNDVVAPDITSPISHPTSIVWGPQRFDQLDVYAPGVANARGDITSYRLIPMPTGGLAHHFEPFTQADLWATKANPLELDAAELPLYARERGSLVNTDIALWYRGSFRHQPRDEDGYYDSSGTWIGTTHTAWTGFWFLPRNLFSQTPLF